MVSGSGKRGERQRYRGVLEAGVIHGNWRYEYGGWAAAIQEVREQDKR